MLSVKDIYQNLFQYYGYQNWWPARSLYEMLIGAILTQNTNWQNVEKALANLGDQIHPHAISAMETGALATLIRPSGFHNQKAERLQIFTQWFKHYDHDIEKVRQVDGETLRKELLALKGVGKETADCMLVYAFNKPSFVIDTYTRRLFTRLGYEVPKQYDDFRVLIESELGDVTVEVCNEYHALIIKHGKEFCSAKPNCLGCPLSEWCDWFQKE